MQNTLINEGLTLMLAGMGTVFVFLTALVIAMTLMARLVGKAPVPAETGGATDLRLVGYVAAADGADVVR